MTIQKAIEKAIEGGWDFPYTSSVLLGFANNFGSHISKKMMHSYFLLDPEFWKALGKSMGWKDLEYYDECNIPGWEYKMHLLVAHIAEGNSIESYFETL